MRVLLLTAAFSVTLPNTSTQPITITCIADPEHAAVWGLMSVTVDEVARHVRIEADRTSPGARVDYWDGAIGSIYTGKMYDWMGDGPVEQFVRVRPKTIEVGWHDLNGELQHYASFARAALHDSRIKCRWHVHWPLGQG